MSRFIGVAYGLAAYAIFFVTILYAIGFTGNLIVPKTIDSGTTGPVVQSIVINLLLLSLFAVQHSVMARQGFKRWWTKYVPAPIERSTFVLFASLILLLLFWQWQPIPAAVWTVENAAAATALVALFWIGWAMVFLSTFLINHFELFGLSQVCAHAARRTPAPPTFRTPFLYRLVRHPLYLGFVIAFWSAPTMSVGHLLFAAVTTAYILIAIQLEERDLVGVFGDQYRRYREDVGMLVPVPGRKRSSACPVGQPAAE